MSSRQLYVSALKAAGLRTGISNHGAFSKYIPILATVLLYRSLQFVSIYPYIHSLGRYWDPRLSFDSEPARKLQPNPCLHACVPQPST